MPKRPPSFRLAGAPTREATNRDHDRQRGTSTQRGYDSVWRRLRIMQLAEFPLCAFHLKRGEVVAATVVDHIESVRDRPDLRLVQSNLQSLCAHCHDSVRQREQAAERNARKAPGKPRGWR